MAQPIRRRRPRLPIIEYPVVLGPTDRNINLNAVALRHCSKSKRGYGVFSKRFISAADPSPIILEAPMFTFLEEVGPRQPTLAETWKCNELYRREIIIDHFPELSSLKPGQREVSPKEKRLLDRCERKRSKSSAPGVRHLYRLATHVAKGCRECGNIHEEIEKQFPNGISMYPLHNIGIDEQLLLDTKKSPLLCQFCRRRKVETAAKGFVRPLKSKFCHAFKSAAEICKQASRSLNPCTCESVEQWRALVYTCKTIDVAGEERVEWRTEFEPDTYPPAFLSDAGGTSRPVISCDVGLRDNGLLPSLPPSLTRTKTL